MNSLTAVLVVLAIAVAVNLSLFFYRQPFTPPDTTAPEQPEQSVAAVAATSPEQAAVPEATIADSGTAATTEPEDTAEGTSATVTPEEANAPATSTPETDATVAPSGETTAGAGDTPILLGDLGGSIESCDGYGQRCVRDLVARLVPGSRYLGGRTDLGTGGGSGSNNKEVSYFEHPALEPCEYQRLEYVARDGLARTVIVLGQGSFGQGPGCIPEI